MAGIHALHHYVAASRCLIPLSCEMVLLRAEHFAGSYWHDCQEPKVNHMEMMNISAGANKSASA